MKKYLLHNRERKRERKREREKIVCLFTMGKKPQVSIFMYLLLHIYLVSHKWGIMGSRSLEGNSEERTEPCLVC